MTDDRRDHVRKLYHDLSSIGEAANERIAAFFAKGGIEVKGGTRTPPMSSHFPDTSMLLLNGSQHPHGESLGSDPVHSPSMRGRKGARPALIQVNRLRSL
jgi:hypothetical protein